MCLFCGLRHDPYDLREGSRAPSREALSGGDHTALYSGHSWAEPTPSSGETYRASGQPVFVTYSFPTKAPGYLAWALGAKGAASWDAFNGREKDLAREALDAWGDASGITFLEVKGGRGDLLFNWVDFDAIAGLSGAAAFAYYPYLGGVDGIEYAEDYSGDVFGNSEMRKNDFADDMLLRHALLHEIGHSIGLKHPFDTESYNRRTLDGSEDHSSNTVMSYTGPWTGKLGPLDLRAAREIYGAGNADGDHLGSWRWNARSEILELNGRSGDDRILGTSVTDVVDGLAGDDTLSGFAGDDDLAGGGGRDRLLGGYGDDWLRPGGGGGSCFGGVGVDVLDLSDLAAPVTIDLARGRAQSGGSGFSLTGIEIAMGGSGDDALTAQAAGSALHAGKGDDVLFGGRGDDLLDGGAGRDTLDCSAETADLRVDLSSRTGQAFELGRDALLGVESVRAGSGDDFLDGGSGANTLDGGAGADRARGFAGQDLLIGGTGNDLLVGGDGADIFVMDDLAGSDRITDFVDGQDRIDLRLVNGVDGFDDLTVEARGGADTLVGWESGSVLLTSIDTASLDARDFFFA